MTEENGYEQSYPFLCIGDLFFRSDLFFVSDPVQIGAVEDRDHDR